MLPAALQVISALSASPLILRLGLTWGPERAASCPETPRFREVQPGPSEGFEPGLPTTSGLGERPSQVLESEWTFLVQLPPSAGRTDSPSRAQLIPALHVSIDGQSLLCPSPFTQQMGLESGCGPGTAFSAGDAQGRSSAYWQDSGYHYPK
jgi:hypothetical protein